MWAVAALLTLVLPAVSAPAPPEVWQGTMTYPCTAACCDGAACVKFLAQDSPINITVRPAAAATGGQASADMAWTWTVLPRPGAPNGHCVPKLEAGLNVSTKGGKWFAQGSGGTSEYYSLEATLSADGNTLSDGIPRRANARLQLPRRTTPVLLAQRSKASVEKSRTEVSLGCSYDRLVPPPAHIPNV